MHELEGFLPNTRPGFSVDMTGGGGDGTSERPENYWQSQRVQALIHLFALGGELVADFDPNSGQVVDITGINIGPDVYYDFLDQNPQAVGRGSVHFSFRDNIFRFGIGPDSQIIGNRAGEAHILAQPQIQEVLSNTVDIGLVQGVVRRYGMRTLPPDLNLSNILKRAVVERYITQEREIEERRIKLGQVMREINSARLALIVLFLHKHPEGLEKYPEGLTLDQFRTGFSSMLGLSKEESEEIIGPKNNLKTYLDRAVGNVITFTKQPGKIGRYGLAADYRDVGSEFSEGFIAYSFRHYYPADIIFVKQVAKELKDPTMPLRYQIIEFSKRELIDKQRPSLKSGEITDTLGIRQDALRYNADELARLGLRYIGTTGETRQINIEQVPDSMPDISRKRIDQELGQDVYNALVRLKTKPDAKKRYGRREIYAELGPDYYIADTRKRNQFIDERLRNALRALGLEEIEINPEVVIDSPIDIVDIVDINEALLSNDLGRFEELTEDVIDITENPQKATTLWLKSKNFRQMKREGLGVEQVSLEEQLIQKPEIAAGLILTDGGLVFTNQEGVVRMIASRASEYDSEEIVKLRERLMAKGILALVKFFPDEGIYLVEQGAWERYTGPVGQQMTPGARKNWENLLRLLYEPMQNAKNTEWEQVGGSVSLDRIKEETRRSLEQVQPVQEKESTGQEEQALAQTIARIAFSKRAGAESRRRETARLGWEKLQVAITRLIESTADEYALGGEARERIIQMALEYTPQILQTEATKRESKRKGKTQEPDEDTNEFFSEDDIY